MLMKTVMVVGSMYVMKSHSCMPAGNLAMELTKKLWVTGPRVSALQPLPTMKRNLMGSLFLEGTPSHFNSSWPRPRAVWKHWPCFLSCTFLAMILILKGTFSPPKGNSNWSKTIALSLVLSLLTGALNWKWDTPVLTPSCQSDIGGG